MSATKLSPRERVREALERVLDCAGTFEERVAPEQLAADRATLEMAFGLAALDVAGEPRVYTLEGVAEMLEQASREVILPPADTAGIVHRAEKSYGYWAAARYLRTLQGGQEK